MMTRFFVLGVLLSLLSLTSAQRPSTVSICSYYANATFGVDNAQSEFNLTSLVVARAVLGGNPTVNGAAYPIDGIAQSSTTSGATNPIIGYFNGQIQFRSGAPDYTRSNFSNPDFASLASKLYSYFGALLGCQYVGTSSGAAGTLAAVSSSDMYNVHKNMTINKASEDYFNNAVARSLTSFGVSQADVAIAGGALGYFNRYGPGIPGNNFIDSTKLTQVCNQADCVLATSANPAAYGVVLSSSTGSSGASSAATVSVAMVLATVIAVVSLVL